MRKNDIKDWTIIGAAWVCVTVFSALVATSALTAG